MLTSDNYGYYKLGNIKTYNKYDIMVKTNDPYKVTWHYNDDFFSQFDWTKEPEESIETLYRKKAEQLRKDYDYIILMYSSGSDSDNILETFVRNNIKLDEVCSLVNLEYSKGENSFANREIYEIACPKIIELNKKYNLKIKHRIFDICSKIIKTYSSYDEDSFKWINNFGAISCRAKHRLYNDIPDWLQLADNDKKICIIWGCEKPRLSVSQDRFYFHFSDIIDGTMCLIDQTMGFQDPFHEELFYWSPTVESANILIKQSHMLKNYLIDTDIREYYSQNRYSGYEEIFIRMKNPNGWFGADDFRDIIYPWWRGDNGFPTKSTNGVFLSSRDVWFWRNLNSESSLNYLNSLQSFTKNIQSNWIENTVMFEGDLYPKQIVKKNSKIYPLQ